MNVQENLVLGRLYDLEISHAYPAIKMKKADYQCRDLEMESNYELWHHCFAHLSAMDRTIQLNGVN